MTPKHLVIFQPSGKRGLIKENKTLKEAAEELGVEIEGICGGKGVCGKCKVEIQEGFFEKYSITSQMGHLSPLESAEKERLSSTELKQNRRLSCLARVRGPILVFVPEEARGGGQIIRKAAQEIPIVIDPVIRKYYLELSQPTLQDSLGDWERLCSGLKKNHCIGNLQIDQPILKELSQILRAADWKVTVTVWNDKEIIRLEPNLNDAKYGMAVDIGTTTVVGYLTDLKTGRVVAVEAMMNPQVAFGEDVMSRITYAMSQEDGLEKLNQAIINGLNQLIKKATDRIGLSIEDLLEMTVVGNTLMHHLFLGIHPSHLGLSPFPPTLHEAIDVRARDLGLVLHPSTNVHVLPIEAGFVGADNVGVLLATEPQNQDEISLVIDIGTNGELVLGNRELGLVSASCATGPAFEGAHIKYGMRAALGAIEHIQIEPDTYEVRYKVIGKNGWQTKGDTPGARGICGSGVIDGIAELFKVGIIAKNGRLNRELDCPRFMWSEGENFPEFVVAWKEETSIERNITITLSDVRAVQLAKAALYAGAKLLMKNLGVEALDKVVLAGAFGSYIDKVASMTIGMFPSCALDKVISVGNAAGDGARIALVNKKMREKANLLAQQVKYIELTVEKDFEKEFMNAMYFPHMRDQFPPLHAILNKIPS
ncbi:MAG: ASKHA domain-containing protein [Candidatus Heimdallarchaeota archaeon]